MMSSIKFIPVTQVGACGNGDSTNDSQRSQQTEARMPILIEKIDPQGIRFLDFMSGKERAAQLPSIIEAEWETV